MWKVEVRHFSWRVMFWCYCMADAALKFNSCWRWVPSSAQDAQPPLTMHYVGVRVLQSRVLDLSQKILSNKPRTCWAFKIFC